MNSHGDRLINLSERWFRLLQRLYPQDFRDDMGDAVVDTYRDRARAALRSDGRGGDIGGIRRIGRLGGLMRLAAVWIRAFFDSLRNGPGERVRPAVSWRRGGNWGRDVEVAFRRLRRAPLFVLLTASTLTVGLGMVAIVYTVVQKVLIEPMPYRDAGDLYYVWRDYGPIADIQRGMLAGTDIVELRKQNAVIEDVAAFQPYLGGIFSIREGTDPSEIAVTVATPNAFEMLGVTPALGRGFARHEEGRGRPNTIVLTHELWTRFGADPNIVGSQVRLQSNPYTVLGVLPPNFTFVRNDGRGVAQRIDAYISVYEDLASADRNLGRYSAIVRARRGASPEAVANAIGTIGRTIDARDFNKRGLKLYPTGLKSDLISRIRPALLVLAAAGILLALMLMVNLSSVLLARAAQREHEFAVSRALGANGAAIVRATLFEGALLGLIGGVAGTFAASWGTRALVALSPLELPRREAIVLDWQIGAVMIALGVMLGLLAAIVPAGWASRASLASLLASSSVRGGGGHGRMRRGMVVTQIALSLVLLSSGGLVMRSFERLLAADPGFDPEGLLTFRIRSPPEFFPQADDVIRFQDGVERALAAIPGVIGASATFSLPLTAAGAEMQISIPGAPGNTGDPDRDRVVVDQIGTRASYVKLMGMRVIAGRAFDPVRREGFREALIDRQLAAQFFPGGANPIGAIIPRRINRRTADGKTTSVDMPLTIVGVVDQARLYDIHQNGRPQLYVRAEDWGYRPMSFVVKTSRQPESIVNEARAAVRSVDARVAVGEVRTMEEIVANVLRQQQTSAVLIGAFALGALLLASMGLFGVVSGSVTRRRHELAVRLALGAEHGRVVRLVIGEGALLVAIGVLVGVPGIYAAGSMLRGVLIEVSPFDPPTLAAVVAGLAAVTLVACYVPARRVLGIDPAQALRNE
jgi:putative ABC transport system permease protein